MAWEEYYSDLCFLADDENWSLDDCDYYASALEEGLWITAVGKEIKISDMSANHLYNTIAWLRKKEFPYKEKFIKKMLEEIGTRGIPSPECDNEDKKTVPDWARLAMAVRDVPFGESYWFQAPVCTFCSSAKGLQPHGEGCARVLALKMLKEWDKENEIKKDRKFSFLKGWPNNENEF